MRSQSRSFRVGVGAIIISALFSTTVNGQLAGVTETRHATGTSLGVASQPTNPATAASSLPLSSSSTSTGGPAIVTFYLAAPILPVPGGTVTKIKSVSLVGSGQSDGTTYTTYVEERVVEVTATTITPDISGEPTRTVSGSSSIMTGTLIVNGNNWSFKAPDSDNFAENCQLGADPQRPSLQCSYQSRLGVGGSSGQASGDYTLTISTSGSSTVTGSIDGEDSASGTEAGTLNTSSSSTPEHRNGARAESGRRPALLAGLLSVLAYFAAAS